MKPPGPVQAKFTPVVVELPLSVALGVAQEIFPLKIPQKILSDGEQFYDFELYNLSKNSRKKIVSNTTEAANSCFGSNQFIITNFDEIKTFSNEKFDEWAELSEA